MVEPLILQIVICIFLFRVNLKIEFSSENLPE